MFLTPQLVVGLITSALNMIIALAMFFLILWQSHTRRDNQIMAFFMVTVMLWGLVSGLFRLGAVLEQPSNYVLQLNSTFFVLNGLAFFALAAYYAGQGKARWVRLFIGAGFILSLVIVTLSINRSIFGMVEKTIGEPMVITILPAGFAPILTSVIYYLIAIALLQRNAHKATKDLQTGGIIVLVGLLLLPINARFFPYIGPVDFAAIASIFFARSILQQNLFAPLASLNEQLTESEGRYRTISNLTSDFAYSIIMSDKFEVEWMTEAFYRVTGHTPQSFSSLDDWREVIHPDDWGRAQERDRQLATGKTVNVEYRLLNKNGEIRWIQDRAQPIMANGRLYKIVGAARDIHDRVTAQQSIRESEEKHRLLLDNLVPPVLALRSDMTIFYYNRAYADLMQIKEGELEGLNLITLFPVFKQTQSYVAYLKAMESGEPQEVNGRFGDREWLARIAPTPWGVLSIAEDITLRKQAEEAQAMSRMKSELLAKVSHELRTPLGAILGYTDMLAAGRGGNLSTRHIGIVDRITINTEKLLSQVNSMLEQVQIELGEIRLHHAPFEPAKLLTNMHAVLDVLATNNELTLTSMIDPNLPATVKGDLQRLQQILVNLAGNGLKFTREGTVEVSLNCRGSAGWEIQVADTGIGIPKDQQEAIFEPFRQLDFSQTREYGGVGLGLAIVKQLVELMDGKILVDSDPGRGSTFTVQLPLVE